MSYLKIQQNDLVNLSHSLHLEHFRANHSGAYSHTSLVNCNTSKYHGLLVCPMPALDQGHHVLLSSLDETIIQHDNEFHLAVHQYPGVIHPGHKYITQYEPDPVPTLYYRVGGVELKKEMLLAEAENRFMIRYTLLNMHSPTTLRLHPFLAFRNIQALSKANFDVQSKYQEVNNGIRTRMYEAYPYLYLQLSRKNDFIAAPDWFYNVEYEKDKQQGEAHHEDLFVPGFFEVQMKKGQSLVFSAALNETAPTSLSRKFNAELSKRTSCNNFENCLEGAARQFIQKSEHATTIPVGFPWKNFPGRESLMALPGLTLHRGKIKDAEAVLQSMEDYIRNACLSRESEKPICCPPDTPLWYIWAVQQYALRSKRYKTIQELFWPLIKDIISQFIKSDAPGLQLNNHLLAAECSNQPLTWMNAQNAHGPVTPRPGMAVEVNALWYNALAFAAELAARFANKALAKKWQPLVNALPEAFQNTFWSEEESMLADYVHPQETSWEVRPNQLLAVSLPFSPLNEEQQLAVLKQVETELLTPRGLRSLSPKSNQYLGGCQGDYNQRQAARHQGTAWPWLTAHYAMACQRLYKKDSEKIIASLYQDFESALAEQTLGNMAECYDGNPPHTGQGLMAYAPSLAAILTLQYLHNSIHTK